MTTTRMRSASTGAYSVVPIAPSSVRGEDLKNPSRAAPTGLL